jgi:hypothetical protein
MIVYSFEVIRLWVHRSCPFWARVMRVLDIEFHFYLFFKFFCGDDAVACS